MLQRVLYNDICRRYGGDLNERQATRLLKTVKHYMGEVHRVQGDKPAPQLNKEVLATVLPDYMMYLDRSRSSARSVVSDIEMGPGTNTVSVERVERIENVDTIQSRARMDVSTAFSALQTQRMPEAQRPPVQKDFQIPLHNEEPISMQEFDRIRKEREQEALRTALTVQQYEEGQARPVLRTQSQPQPHSGQQQQGQAERVGQQQQGQAERVGQQQQGQQAFAEATEVFARDRRRAADEADALFAERERQRLQVRAATVLPVPPDMRSVLMGDRQELSRTMNIPYQVGSTPVTVSAATAAGAAGANESAGNMVTALPSRERSSGGGLPQLTITREPDTMAYKETETNVFIYSGDRNWTSNSQETRYNFSILFNPTNLDVGSRMNPTVTTKLRNIVRIELVKAIMPGEGLDILVTKTGASTYDSTLNMNILSYPYIQVRIPELDTNNFGTNQGLDSAFAVLQYDANWITDSGNSQQRGYFAMIPKFLKCQKVYTPTPLATIQKLSFRFERPDGSLLSAVPDTVDVARIYPTLVMTPAIFTTANALTNTIYKYDSTTDVNASGYYWIQTSAYFNHWTVSKGDRILMSTLLWATSPTGVAAGQQIDFLNTMASNKSLLVVGTGIITGTGAAAVFADGYNSQGYANAILVRAKFSDPTTGSVTPALVGGVADGYGAEQFSYFAVNTAITAGRILNQSHQVQVAMRVITRDVDSTGILRPDNL